MYLNKLIYGKFLMAAKVKIFFEYTMLRYKNSENLLIKKWIASFLAMTLF